jgi:hypothetical protein
LPGDPKSVEVGAFDPVQGRLRRIQSFPKDGAGGKVVPFITVNQDASRFVLTTRKEDRGSLLLLDSAGKTIRSIPCPETVLMVAHLAWGQDSRTIWLSAAVREKQAGEMEFGLAEVNIESGQSRVYPLCPAKGKDDGTIFYLQPSLSPDKKWLAIVPFNEQEKEIRLLLFDLTTPERKMTKIPIPLPKEQPKDAGEAKGKE